MKIDENDTIAAGYALEEWFVSQKINPLRAIVIMASLTAHILIRAEALDEDDATERE